MYGLQRPTKENVPASPVEKYTLPTQMKQTLYTQPGITYAHITKQNSYTATNIEQEPHINQPHQQTSNIQDLKDIMKSLFEQMGTMIILTIVPDTTFRRTENIYLYSQHSCHVNLRDALRWKKAIKNFPTIQSLPYEPSSQNCSRWNYYNNKDFHQASRTKQL
jgi:hypothetical protein